MSQMETNFNDLGVDAIKGTEIMQLLDLGMDDLSVPQNFSKFKDILSFVKTFDNYRYVIQKITRGKNIDKLAHCYEYINLMKQRDDILTKYEDMSKHIDNLSKIGSEDEKKAVTQRFVDLKNTIDSLESEMYLFEK